MQIFQKPRDLNELRTRKIAVVAGTMAAGIGGYHLAAWLSGAMTFRGLTQITMKTNAALCLLLCSLALIMVALGAEGWVRRVFVGVLAAVAMTIGSLTFLEHIFGWNFGIDQLLAKEPPGALGFIYPNRMGPPGALTYALGGTSLLSLLRRQGRAVRVAQWLALVLSILALMGMLGYLYGVKGLYGAAKYTVIAWPATVGNFTLGIGLLCASPREGLMAPVISPAPGGTALRRLLPPAIVVPILLGWLRLQGEWHGLYERYFGTTILVLSWILVFSFLVYRVGIWLTEAFDRERAASDALLRAQTLLLEAEKLSHTGAWEWDLTTDLWRFSDEWQRVHGIDANTLKPEELISIAYPDDRPAIEEALKKLRKGESPYEMEHRVIRQYDGDVRTVRARGQFVKNEAGEVVRVYGFVQDITKQKRAEAARREIEESLRLFFEHAPAALAMFDAKMRYINVSRRWVSDFGLQGRNVIGLCHYDVFPEISAQWREIHRRALAGEVVTAEEDPFRRPDGSVQWLRWEVRPWHDVLGRVAGIAIFSEDITERKQAGEALRQSEARLNAALENLREGVVMATTTGHIFYWNPAASEMHGYGSAGEELHGPLAAAESIFQLWSLDESQMISLDDWPMPRVIKGEVVKDCELRLRRPAQGWERIVSYSGARLETAAGEEIVFLSVYDLTGLRHAEEEVKRSEEKFRAVFEQAAVGIGRVRFSDARWIDVNETFCRMLGYSREEMLATPWPEITYRDDVDLDLIPFKRMAAGEIGNYTVEKRFIHKQGQLVWARLSLSVVRDIHGQPNYEIAVIEDVTDRKRAEEQREQVIEELARSNRELEQFAYVSSHDLQEPLRTLANYVQLLQKRYQGELDEKGQKYLSYIFQAATRMSLLISDLLAFSRIGAVERAFDRVAMESVLQQALDSLKSIIRENSAEVAHDPLPVVAGDQVQLVQLLQNLIGNAIKYRKKGVPPRVSITVQREDREWVFGVHDNGIGIAPEFYDKIFVIFQRLHLREEYPGTGIGLAICRKIVERHGGRIWVESKPGKGASFYFTIPANGEQH